MNVSEELYKIALKDLEASEVLYSCKHYPQSIFFLQQSIEKVIKSFGLKIEVIDESKMLQKIKHYPHKVFSQYFKQEIDKIQRIRKTPILVPEIIPPHQRNDTREDNYLQMITRLKQKLEQINIRENQDVDSKAITGLILGAKELEKHDQINEEEIFQKIKNDLILTHQHFEKLMPNDQSIKEISRYFQDNADEIARGRLNERIILLNKESDFKYVSFVWINLALLFAPHEQSSRYPIVNNVQNASRIDYNLKHPIVTNIPELIKMFRKSIDKYNNVYNI